MALLKVTQGQDVLLQHLQATQPPQPPQQSLQAMQPLQPQQQMLATQAPQQDSSFLPGSIHTAPTAPAQPSFVLPTSQATMPIPATNPHFSPSSFVPPINNTGHSAYSSIQSLFPNIEELLLLAIGHHALHLSQISKLDTCLCDKQVSSNLAYENGKFVRATLTSSGD